MLYQSQKILIKLSVSFYNLLYYCRRHFYTLCETKADQLIAKALRMILITMIKLQMTFFHNFSFSFSRMTLLH